MVEFRIFVRLKEKEESELFGFEHIVEMSNVGGKHRERKTLIFNSVLTMAKILSWLMLRLSSRDCQISSLVVVWSTKERSDSAT